MFTGYHERRQRQLRQDEECEESPCAGKKGYRSRVAAEHALQRVLSHQEEWNSPKWPCRAYECTGATSPCFRWHLTSVPDRYEG